MGVSWAQVYVVLCAWMDVDLVLPMFKHHGFYSVLGSWGWSGTEKIGILTRKPAAAQNMCPKMVAELAQHGSGMAQDRPKMTYLSLKMAPTWAANRVLLFSSNKKTSPLSASFPSLLPFPATDTRRTVGNDTPTAAASSTGRPPGSAKGGGLGNSKCSLGIKT